MPSQNDPNDLATWTADVGNASESDKRIRPWEAVVEASKAEHNAGGDVIDLEANPSGACDISVSA